MFDEIAWLEGAGHEIAHFSTKHPENDKSPWSGFFAPYLELGVHGSLTVPERYRAALRMFWNREAARSFARLLRDFRPDLVHIHGIHHQISPSILRAARDADVPVVQTLHDHHPVCPAGALIRGDLAVCEPPSCTRANLGPCVLHHCVHHSLARSLVASSELFWRRWMVGYEALVDAFICPSQYLGSRIARGVFPRTPVHIVPNAVPERPCSGLASDGQTFVYAGRLSPEKGLPTLLRAAYLAGVRLVVAGDGPMLTELRVSASDNVHFVGRLDGDGVDHLLLNCRAAVLPSECVENAPMAVLEAMMLARPVIASRIGGVPEQIRDGLDGILVTPSDEVELAAAMRVLADTPHLADRLGRSAHERASAQFSPDRHTASLLRVYGAVLRGSRPRAKGSS